MKKRALFSILAILITSTAFAHDVARERDRYTDANGVPYGGQNPPVFAESTGAHCMYSVYGCTGAGGSTGPHGYRIGGPYGHPVHGVVHGGCGTSKSYGGSAGVHDGNGTGSVYFHLSETDCDPTGYSQQNLGGSLGVVNGQPSGGIYFSRSTSN